MTLTDKEKLIHRIGFLEGKIDQIRTIYTPKTGDESLVIHLERPLNEVLLPYREEMQKLLKELNDRCRKSETTV